MNTNMVKKADSGLVSWFVNNPVAANLLMAMIVIAGLLSASGIKKKIFPDFDVNSIQVSVSYPGAGAGDIEQSVVLKLEEAVRDVSGIKRVVSFAWEGRGTMRIEVETGYDVDEVYDAVKSSVEGLTTLPEKARQPVVSKNQPVNRVASVAIYGDVDQLSLQRLAQSVQQELLGLPEVTKTSLRGERPQEIAIELSEVALQKYGLSFGEIARKLRLSSVDLAGGSIKTSTGDISVKARGQGYSGLDFADFVIRTNSDGSRLKLGDIADIKEDFAESDGVVRFNGQPAVVVSVQSEGDQNDIETVKAVRQYLADRQVSLPVGIKTTLWADSSYYLQGRMNMMLENMMYGALLVFMLLSLFLRLRVAFWVVVGIPVCFLGAIWLMPIGPIPISINLISLFAFILVLGVVVDDAIIIGESIYSETSKYGHSKANVIRGVNRVVVPATFGVLTTMAAFLPVLFVQGQSSPFFESIGVVVILCLLFSIIESKFILPAHLAHSPSEKKATNGVKRLIVALQDLIDKGLKSFISRCYLPLLSKAIDNRYITLSLFIGLLVIILGVAASPIVRFVFFPKLPSDFAQVELQMNAGTPIAERNKVMQRVEEAIYKLNNDYAATHDGEQLLDALFSRSWGDTQANFTAELTKSENRTLNTFQLVDRWRDYVGEIPGVRTLNFTASSNAGGSKPIYFRLSGNDYQQLKAAAQELSKRLTTYDGVFDVENSLDSNVDEVGLVLKPEGEALGLTLSELGNQVRQGFYGEEVQRIQSGRDEIKVMLRYPREDRSDLEGLENIRIRTSSGGEAPFYEVADIEMGSSASFIRRTNGKRSIAVMAEVDTKEIEPAAIIEDIQTNYLPDLFARYPQVSTGLEGTSLEQQKLYRQMSIAGLVALLLIYALIAIPLSSYLQPLVIMAIIPFGLVGAIIGHIIFDVSFSLLSVYGLIALAGVLVNDSLIFVDFVNKARQAGESSKMALMQSGQERFRAIVLTSLTTFLGLVPITFETSLQAQIVVPMAISLGFGILFATAITLFLIPTLYMTGLDVKKGVRRIRHILA